MYKGEVQPLGMGSRQDLAVQKIKEFQRCNCYRQSFADYLNYSLKEQVWSNAAFSANYDDSAIIALWSFVKHRHQIDYDYDC